MNAAPILASIARALREQQLEAVLIGNAAAALHGAPVTTLDFDFLFRRTPGNLEKLRAVAKFLGAVVYKPYYPASSLLRLSRDEDALQLDFMSTIHGMRSYQGLLKRGVAIKIEGELIRVAALENIIESKRAADRPRDRAVWDVLEITLQAKRPNREQVLTQLKLETDRDLLEQIRRLLQKPMCERTHFLRKKVGFTSSCF